MTYGDYDFLSTKKIKKNELFLTDDYMNFTNWVFDTYQLRPINILFDVVETIRKSRLRLIFEKDSDCSFFYNNGTLFTDNRISNIIIEQYKNEFLKDSPVRDYDMFFVVSSFQKVAIEEVYDSINDREMMEVCTQFSLNGIEKTFGGLVVFLDEETETDDSKKIGQIEQAITRELYMILTKYDEFGYLDESSINIQFNRKGG